MSSLLDADRGVAQHRRLPFRPLDLFLEEVPPKAALATGPSAAASITLFFKFYDPHTSAFRVQAPPLHHLQD